MVALLLFIKLEKYKAFYCYNLTILIRQDELMNNKIKSDVSPLEKKLISIEKRANEAEARALMWQTKTEALQLESARALRFYRLAKVETIWNFIKPLQNREKFIKKLLVGGKNWITFAPKSRPRRAVRYLLISAAKLAGPKTKIVLSHAMDHLPALKARLSQAMHSGGAEPIYLFDKKTLSLDAKKILDDIHNSAHNNGSVSQCVSS